jgi:hypothetical protein
MIILSKRLPWAGQRTTSHPVGRNFDPFGSFLNVELEILVTAPSSTIAVTVK